MQTKRTPARTMLFVVIPALLVIVAAVVVFYVVSRPSRAVVGGIQSSQLENGLKMVVYEDPTVPIVSVNVWYRVGSRNEEMGKRGVAHLMEHMMFKGSKNYGPEQHAQEIDQVGGIANAFTREDVTGYWETLPSSQLELALKLEAERMDKLDLTDPKLKSEREVVKEEHRLALQNQPFGRVLSKFRSIAFKDSPYAWTAAGDMSDLDSVTIDYLQNFYHTYYAPNNAVLIVAGNAKASDVFSLARKYFGPIPKNDKVPPIKTIPVPEPTAMQEEQLTMAVQLPIILGGYRLPKAGDPDLPALEVASMILSQGDSSRLRKKLVRAEKIAVGAFGVPLTYRDVGVFIAGAVFTADKDPQKVKNELIAEIERLKTEDVSPAELQKAKNQLTAQDIFGQDALSGIAQSIGEAEVILGDYHEYFKNTEKYSQVTAQKIREVANKYFSREHLTLVVLNPEK